MSGLEFSEVLVGTGRARRPYAPSLDRIDRSRGYEPENVRLVTAVANFAMNPWGLERVLDLARAMAQKHAEEVRDPSDQAWLARPGRTLGSPRLNERRRNSWEEPRNGRDGGLPLSSGHGRWDPQGYGQRQRRLLEVGRPG